MFTGLSSTALFQLWRKVWQNILEKQTILCVFVFKPMTAILASTEYSAPAEYCLRKLIL